MNEFEIDEAKPGMARDGKGMVSRGLVNWSMRSNGRLNAKKGIA